MVGIQLFCLWAIYRCCSLNVKSNSWLLQSSSHTEQLVFIQEGFEFFDFAVLSCFKLFHLLCCCVVLIQYFFASKSLSGVSSPIVFIFVLALDMNLSRLSLWGILSLLYLSSSNIGPVQSDVCNKLCSDLLTSSPTFALSDRVIFILL